MRVFITSCYTGPDTFRQKEERLRQLHAASLPRLHELVDGPSEADIILVGNIRDDHHYRAVMDEPLLSRYPEKCFAVCDLDRPPILIRGVYTCARRSILNFRRLRSGSYTAFPRRNPYLEKYAGRVPESDRRYLFSFMGSRATHPVRDRLLSLSLPRADVLLVDTSNSFPAYDRPFSGSDPEQESYCRTLCDSKFVLCPRGKGCSSVRLFEAMELGVAPVIISDAWLPPAGIDWPAFAIFVPEAAVERVADIVKGYGPRWREMGQLARQAFERNFAESAYFNYVVEQCDSLRRGAHIPERVFWRLRRLNYLAYRTHRKLAGLRY